MRTDTTQPIRLKDYRPPDWLVETVSLDVSLHPTQSKVRATLALKPNHALAWNNLGLALQSINDVHGALEAFRRAVELEPDFAHAHWNLSLALLLDGQFAQGWREYDWRLVLSELGRGRHVYPGQA